MVIFNLIHKGIFFGVLSYILFAFLFSTHISSKFSAEIERKYCGRVKAENFFIRKVQFLTLTDANEEKRGFQL